MVDVKSAGSHPESTYDPVYVASLNARCQEFGITSEQLWRLVDRTGATPVEIISALARSAPSRAEPPSPFPR